MKGPSLDAIRKFKQQQEQRKREEDAKKVQEKLSTLEHRAAQGDRKAKVQLKKIEEVRETRQDSNKYSDVTRNGHRGPNGSKQSSHNFSSSASANKDTAAKRKPKNDETDFEELMRLAASNTNEIRKQEEKPKVVKKIIPKHRSEPARLPTPPPPPPSKSKKMPVSYRDAPIAPMRSRVEPRPSTSRSIPQRPQQNIPHRPQQHVQPRQPIRSIPPPRFQSRPPVRRAYDEDEYDDDEEDEYESDGFVVDEYDDEAAQELSKTLKDVFRYDKRRCDLREQEVDRQYRLIGNVSSFEDLEREERRASRLAAAEDAKELKEEEERKRLKKLRLKGYRD